MYLAFQNLKISSKKVNSGHIQGQANNKQATADVFRS